jgi:hypothetical protein
MTLEVRRRDRRGVVGAPVVDHDDLDVLLRRRGAERMQRRTDAGRFLVGGDHHAERRPTHAANVSGSLAA